MKEIDVMKDAREQMKLNDFLEISFSRKKALVLITTLTMAAIMMSACEKKPEATPEAVSPPEPPMVEVTEVATETPETTANMEPTPTEIQMSARPDFESMSDDELIQIFDEYRMLFVEQIDCSPEVEKLLVASKTPELTPNELGDAIWRTELLGTYQVPLKGKDGLPAGYINCLYFAGSEPGGVFTAMGGGELWGEEILTNAKNAPFGLSLPTNIQDWVRAKELMPLLKAGEEYKFGPTIANPEKSWIRNRETYLKALHYYADLANYAHSLMYFTINMDGEDWIITNINSGFPGINSMELISNTKMPARIWDFAPFVEE